MSMKKLCLLFEALFQRYPYFLDCQYYIINCIETIDKEARLLVSTLTELMQKLAMLYPDLETVTTREGISLCSKQTSRFFRIFAKQEGQNDDPAN